MDGNLTRIALYVMVVVFGLHYVVAFALRKAMYIPGETLKPDEKPFGRFFVLILGIIMVVWAGYSLITL